VPKSPSGSNPGRTRATTAEWTRSIKQELDSIIKHDDSSELASMPPTSERYIVSSRFVATWLLYVVNGSGCPPTCCDNTDLLTLATHRGVKHSQSVVVKDKLEMNVHYRHVNAATWNTYARFYPGSGPAIKTSLKDVDSPGGWLVVEQKLGRLMLRAKMKRMKRLGTAPPRFKVPGLFPAGQGGGAGSPTLKASFVDPDDLLFKQDTNDVLQLALQLSSALEGPAAESPPPCVVNREWARSFMDFALGISKKDPGPLNNAVLLEQHETLMGPSWSRAPKTEGPGEASWIIFVTSEVFLTIQTLIPGSGPAIDAEPTRWKVRARAKRAQTRARAARRPTPTAGRRQRPSFSSTSAKERLELHDDRRQQPCYANDRLSRPRAQTRARAAQQPPSLALASLVRSHPLTLSLSLSLSLSLAPPRSTRTSCCASTCTCPWRRSRATAPRRARWCTS
jgi:hypothetical protein